MTGVTVEQFNVPEVQLAFKNTIAKSVGSCCGATGDRECTDADVNITSVSAGSRRAEMHPQTTNRVGMRRNGGSGTTQTSGSTGTTSGSTAPPAGGNVSAGVAVKFTIKTTSKAVNGSSPQKLLTTYMESDSFATDLVKEVAVVSQGSIVLPTITVDKSSIAVVTEDKMAGGKTLPNMKWPSAGGKWSGGSNDDEYYTMESAESKPGELSFRTTMQTASLCLE